MVTSEDDQRREVALMGEMYIFQVDLIGALNTLHQSGVDLTMYSRG
jgi:hypothetical protein